MRARLPDRKSRVTVTEVAAACGVSPATVSRIMRGQTVVAEPTRERVMATVRALGYVPNRIAGSLASMDTRLIGVVIPSLHNIVFPEVLRGVHAGLEGTGYQAVISVTDYDPDREEAAVRNLLAWQPAALLLAGFDHTDATRRMLGQSAARVVEMMDLDQIPFDVAVGLSHHRAGVETGRHLIAKGYRRFGYVGHDWHTDLRAKRRFDGLMQALTEAGLPLVAEARCDGPSSLAEGRRQTARLRASAPEVDVAVYSNDDMAVGGVFHCMAAGITLPQDFAIFGFNGLEIGRDLPQPLSTLRSNRFRIGRDSVGVVMACAKRPSEPQIIDTGFEVFAGETA